MLGLKLFFNLSSSKPLLFHRQVSIEFSSVLIAILETRLNAFYCCFFDIVILRCHLNDLLEGEIGIWSGFNTWRLLLSSEFLLLEADSQLDFETWRLSFLLDYELYGVGFESSSNTLIWILSWPKVTAWSSEDLQCDDTFSSSVTSFEDLSPELLLDFSWLTSYFMFAKTVWFCAVGRVDCGCLLFLF